jgi:hypothetical protein
VLPEAVRGSFDPFTTDVGAADHPASEVVVLDSHDSTLLQGADRIEGSLDFSQLDAEAANLDLGVGAAYKVDQAVFTQPSEVAGTIQAAGVPAAWVWQERTGRLLRVSTIAMNG